MQPKTGCPISEPGISASLAIMYTRCSGRRFACDWLPSLVCWDMAQAVVFSSHGSILRLGKVGGCKPAAASISASCAIICTRCSGRCLAYDWLPSSVFWDMAQAAACAFQSG
eukprot:1164539-Rhodomonas_salina.1